MAPRIDLPEPLRRRPFNVASASESGIGRGRLRGPDLAIPFRGSRVPETSTPAVDASVAERVHWRCAALAPVMPPSQFFSHTTAAHLWGCPFQEVPAPADLHVSTLAPLRSPRREGVIGHQLAEVDVIDRAGLRVVDPASVFLQSASLLPLSELVAIGDHLILDPRVLDPLDLRPYTTLDRLRSRLDVWAGRGRRRAITAWELLRQGAESRPETLLRLLLAANGCPEPELNPELRGVRRRWNHWADLVYRERRVIVEYDGDQHRTDTRQWDHDIRRFDDFAEDGWRVVRVRSRPLQVSRRDRRSRACGPRRRGNLARMTAARGRAEPRVVS